MKHEWILARAFVGAGRAGRLHSSFVVSIVGVFFGVAFLVLTLGVYDSYVAKLESIAFSLYPHVLLVDAEGPTGTGSPAGSAESAENAAVERPEPGVDGTAGTLPESPLDDTASRCTPICQGRRVLGAERWTDEGGGLRSALPRVDRLRRAFVDHSIPGVLAPVILEEGELLFDWPASRSAPGALSPTPLPSPAERLARARPVRVLGVDPEAAAWIPRIDLVLRPEQLEALRRNPDTIFLADRLWTELRAASPAHRSALDPRTLRLGSAGATGLEAPLGGTFELGFHSLAHNLLITSVDMAQAILGLDQQVSYAGVALADPYDSRAFVEQTAPFFARAGFRTTDWTRIAGGDFESIRLFRWILFLVLGLSFSITALGIRNALAILTLERRRQIGILRALGSKDRSLRWIFLAIACGIGLAGAVPGALAGSWLGLRFGAWVDQQLAGVLPIQGIEASWHPMVLVQVLTLVVLVCAITSMMAVGRALKLDPVACLREE